MHRDARIVYWAAHYGQIEIVKTAIQVKRISPFIKCFKQRTMIIGAVLGGQHEVLEYILSFLYKAWDDEDIHKLKKMLILPDIKCNTALHYAYS